MKYGGLPAGSGLTIRSSRDRFAARLARYRVPPRRAATRPGLTQVLGRMEFSRCVIEELSLIPRLARICRLGLSHPGGFGPAISLI